MVKFSRLLFLVVCLCTFEIQIEQLVQGNVIIGRQWNFSPQNREIKPAENTTTLSCTTRKGSAGKCTNFSSCFPFIYRSTSTTTGTDWEKEFGNVNSGLAEEIYNSTQNSDCNSASSAATAGENEDMICCALERKVNFESTQQPKPISPFPKENLQCGEIKTHLYNSQNRNDQDQAAVRALGSLKITGGREAQRGEFPWMVAIVGPNGKHLCGGSLLNMEYVLTAAHCLSTFNSTDVAKLTATIGDHNIKSTKDGAHEHRKISKIFIHAGFKMSNHLNDIALMKLEKPVGFTNYIQPICLPNKNVEMIEGLKSVVSGWGRDRSYGSLADTLRKVEIPIWRLEECKRIYGIFAPGRLADSNVCAGDGKKNKDACIGDSGGPLSVIFGSRWHQVGIVSWGKGCGSFPGVYTRVDSFLPWIEKNMQS